LKRAFRRFEDIKAEFMKIEWTEEGQVATYAKIVVLATFMSGMVLYLADLVIQRTLYGFQAILRLIFG
jgi:preprotein translocase subunit SecE